jgi:DNA-binding LacI/PurR family transcriptional regulator
MPTMHDVAKRAGVSVSTVSYALSGLRPISEETRKRIFAAMADLGYQPHALARKLASKHSKLLALVYPPINRTLGATELTFVTSISNAARARGYSLLVSTIDYADLGELRQLAQQGLVDGIILMEVHLDDPRVALLQEIGLPFSLIGHRGTNAGVNFVDADFRQTILRGVEYLANLGHQQLAFFNFSVQAVTAGYGPAARTRQAFEEALGLYRVRGAAHACGASAPAGYELTYRLLNAKRPCTAILTFNERAMPGILQAAQDRGRRIPDELSLVAVSSASVAEMFTPALTTLELPISEMGRIGTEILIDQLEGNGQGTTQILLPSPLVVRQSSGPCERCSPVVQAPRAARRPVPAPDR